MVSPVSRRKRAGQHLRRTAPAEIGLEQRCQRRPRGQGGERRRGEARHLLQQRGFRLGEGPRGSPAEHGLPTGPSDVELSAAGPATSSCTSPVPSPASQSRPALPCSGPAGPRDPKPSASITAPVSARHSQVRRAMIGCGAAKRQRAAGERQAIGDAAARRASSGSGRGQARRWPRRSARRESRAVACQGSCCRRRMLSSPFCHRFLASEYDFTRKCETPRRHLAEVPFCPRSFR